MRFKLKAFGAFGVLIFLGSIIVFSSVAAAFTGSGTGTAGDPFRITTCAQLQEIQSDLDAHYHLMNNIDCSATSGWNAGEGFEPIGNDSNSPTSYFTGTLDGQGFVVTGLFINRPVTENVGLFGFIGDGAEISNIGMQNVNMTGNRNTGGLVGSVDGSSGINITSVYTTGTVTGTDILVGGLIGNNDAAAIIQSYSTATVTGEEDVGGLIGDNYGDISRSFATGDVTASSGEWIGGLLGYNDGGTITDVYATGDVNAGFVFSGVGGLIGQNLNGSITNAYSTGEVTVVDAGSGNIGGFIGDNQDTIATSFWDTDTSGLVDGCGTGSANCSDVSSKTTTEMKNITTFTGVGWDFTAIWDINGTDNNGYPFFRWQTSSTPTDGDGVSDAVEDAAPNGGDGNNDGTADSQQANVVSFVNSVSNKYVTLEASSACTISAANMSAESTTTKDAGFNYPQGLMNFTFNCGTPGFTATVIQYYHGISGSNLVLRKYNPNASAYTAVTNASIQQVTTSTQTVAKITYQVTDGGILDTDGTVDGTIVDPAGLAQSVVGVPNTGLGGRLYN